MNKTMSEAAVQGWFGGSIEPSLEKAKAKVELEYLEDSSAVGARVISLEMCSARLKEHEARVQAYIGSLMAERSLSTPFDWMLSKVQLAMLKRKRRPTEQALADARSGLGRLRERADAKLALLESEVRSAYIDGSRLRELTGQIGRVQKEVWNVLQ